MSKLCFALLLLSTLCRPALAQLPPVPPAPTSLVGSYEVTNLDGTPVSPGHTVTMDVSVQGGVMIGLVKVDGVLDPTETTTFEKVGDDPLLYIWTNARNNMGMTGWNAATQRFEEIIVTGPNAGKMDALCPR